ncbi:MAG: BamA/TamA family outer membrane protein [Alphaproteobacteria bacterium]
MVLAALLPLAGLAACSGGDPVGELAALLDFGPLNGGGYQVSISGLDDLPDIHTLVRDSSALVERRREAPPTPEGLARRADADAELMRRILRSQGFYGAVVETRIDSSTDPVAVTLAVTPGPPYLLSSYDIIYEDGGDGLPGGPAAVDLTLGDWARAADIEAAGPTLLRRIGRQGHPFATITRQVVVVDHDAMAVAVALQVAEGPHLTYGPTSASGLVRVRPDYVAGFIPWQPGETVSTRQMDQVEEELRQTRLFEFVAVSAQRPPAAQTVRAGAAPPVQAAPILIETLEAPPRSIGLGGDYTTETGPGATATWEHRNFFGRNETLAFRGRLTGPEQRAAADFAKPHFRHRNQSLLLNSETLVEDGDAFDEKTISGFAGLQRPIGNDWSVRWGGALEYTEQANSEGEADSVIAGLPVRFLRDTSDDPLDPTTGSRVAFSLIPAVSLGDSNGRFLTLEETTSRYWPLTEDRSLVAAGRLRLGVVLGADRLDLPPSRRFYGGGAGSVRGYGQDSLGRLDASGAAVGGRSIVEFGGELRARLSETIGVVPFLEAGNSYDRLVPQANERLQWAAGVGLRYFTVIGPLRLDLAFPLNRRRELDSTYELYFSIGQAF